MKTSHSINFAYGNDVLFDIIRNKITDAEKINQKSRIKIDAGYAKKFADEMKKYYPDNIPNSVEIILEDIKPDDIFIVQDENPVTEAVPAKNVKTAKPVEKPVYLKRQELVPKDVINKKKTNIIQKEEEEDTIEIED